MSASFRVDESNEISQSLSLEEFTENETVNVLGQLSALPSNDLRKYFKGFRQIYSGLLEKKTTFEVEEVVYLEELKNMVCETRQVKNSLSHIRNCIEAEQSNVAVIMEDFIVEISQKTPETSENIQHIWQMQRNLSYLKFVKNFIEQRDEVRKSLRLHRYNDMIFRYEKLKRIPDDLMEFDRTAQGEYKIRMESLNQFLLTELRTALLEHYATVNFPFENAVDYTNRDIISQLTTSVEILKCIALVDESSDRSLAFEIVLSEFGKRFNFHFYGDRNTNRSSNPEWFFTQISEWLDKNQLYFVIYIQKFLDDMNCKKDAMREFLLFLIGLTSNKVRCLIRNESFVSDRRLLSHLIDETVLFERELLATNLAYNYACDEQIHVIDQLCEQDVLDSWFQIEHDAISVAIDEMLTSGDAYDSRYKSASDVDPYLVPNFADSFVLLMQSMTERYSTIPNVRLQRRFVVLQILIADEFRSRIAQIIQQIDIPWRSPNAQLMNALWYLKVILDDWSSMPHFVRLQFHLLSSNNSLVHGVFDESSILYQHFWRQCALNMTNCFVHQISEKLRPYTQEKWCSWELPKPVNITPSFSPFLCETKRLIDWINNNISSESILSIYYLTNNEIWSLINKALLAQTSFNSRGACQMLYDVTTALIPLLNCLYLNSKLVGVFDVIMNENCIKALNSLRALSLPSPAIILLKSELDEISQQTLNERLEQFNITGLDRESLIQLFAQRCDVIVI